MDDKITVEVELKSKLDKLTQLDTSQLKLSEKQKEALEINKQGAETALKNNDLKEFRFYFNQFADILKKAMIEIFDKFNSLGLKSKMLIQVHDELVFNVLEKERETVEKIVTDIMENTYKLSVPLKVEINEGKNWYDAK